MAKNGFFPLIGPDTFTTTAATTWGNTTSMEVGVINIATAHDVTFDSANYPGEAGDCVIVINTTSGSQNAIISPAPFGDADADTAALTAGDSVVVVYHPDNGWIFMGLTAAS